MLPKRSTLLLPNSRWTSTQKNSPIHVCNLPTLAYLHGPEDPALSRIPCRCRSAACSSASRRPRPLKLNAVYLPARNRVNACSVGSPPLGP